MKRKLFTLALLTGLIGQVFGANYYTSGNISDWTALGSYRLDTGSVPSALPGAGDIIWIRVEDSCVLDVTDTASWNLVNGVKALSFVRDGTSTAPVNLATLTIKTGTDGTLNIPVTAGWYAGKVIKLGSGTLTLNSGYQEYGASTYLFRMLQIREGSVMCAPNLTNADSKSPSLPIIDVSEGATFGAPPVSGAYYSTALSLCGKGTITTAKAGSRAEFRLANSMNWPEDPREFSGKLDTYIDLFNPRYINLTGTESTMQYQVKVHYGYGAWDGPSGVIGVMKFGNISDAASSLGRYNTINFNVYGGVYRYLGTGETSDKNFTVSYTANTTNYFAGFDGGPNGGLVLKGAIGTANTSVTNSLVVKFGGTNSTPCVFKGNINTWVPSLSTVYRGFSVFKCGSGTWKFSDNGTVPSDWDKRNIFGALSIDEGTLQFDSMSVRGEPCSIGHGKLLYPPQIISPIVVDEQSLYVDYNFRLGTPTTEGTLESVITNAINATTRPIALAGNGRLLNNSAHRAWYRCVEPVTSGEHTLTLDGSSTAENSVFDIVDTATAPVTVVKKGTGTWHLKGNTTFRGPIDIRGGKVVVSNITDTAYTWYRLTFKDTQDQVASGSWNKANLGVTFMGLYDSDYNLITHGITTADGMRASAVEPGQAGYESIRPIATGNYGANATTFNFDYVFSSTSLPYKRYNIVRYNYTKTRFVTFSTTNPDAAVAIVFRLPLGAKPATSFDMANIYGWATGNKGGFPAHPKVFSLEGSIDGCHWENANPTGLSWSIDKDTYVSTQYDSGWIFSGKDEKMTANYGAAGPSKDSVKKHVGGATIRGTVLTNNIVLPNCPGVKVANNSTFELLNMTKTVSVLGLDGTENTVDGIDIGEIGVLYLSNISYPKEKTIVLPTVFKNTANLERLVNWTVMINGRPTYCQIEVIDNHVVVKYLGYMIRFG